MIEDLSRLKSNLANGKIRETDFPTYQVINALIDQVMKLQKALEIRLVITEGDSSGAKERDYLTHSDESLDLPNSRELQAGARVSFDDSVANERTVTANAIDQLTGDVTAAGSGSVAATIANDAVTYAKIQNVSAVLRLLGRGDSGGAGDVQELTLGAGLSIVGTELSAETPSDWDVLTDGDLIEPELIFAGGEVIMVEIP